MKSFYYLFLLFTAVFVACNPNKPNEKVVKVNLSKIVLPTNDRFPVSKEYRDIDTLINLSLFDLKPYATNISKKEKIKAIIKAVKTALPITAYQYLELGCWRMDNKANEPYTDSLAAAPDCRVNDFHFIDLDNDGDLDILYASLADQYVRTDGNEFILLQNKGKEYKYDGVSGYLYQADFSKRTKGLFIFKTVSRGCCEEWTYHFFTTVFNSKNWTMKTSHDLEIGKSRVKETY